MFGYVSVKEPELKVRELRRYREYYCGLCSSLRKRYGIRGQFTLNYDMVFLAVLLTGLYEDGERHGKERCLLHPVKTHACLENRHIEYAADMTILMAYYNLLDNWKDDHKKTSLFAAGLLRKDCLALKEKYPRQAKAAARYMKRLAAYEKNPSAGLDEAAGMTGELLAELFTEQEDIWSGLLRRTGFFLGKFIYLMDACEDLEEDLKKGRFNPLEPYKDRPDFGAWCDSILNLTMAECAGAFEQLPILLDAGILRNIIYAGVWNRRDLMNARDIKKTERRKK